jgi:hypothetical protein
MFWPRLCCCEAKVECQDEEGGKVHCGCWLQLVRWGDWWRSALVFLDLTCREVETYCMLFLGIVVQQVRGVREVRG